MNERLVVLQVLHQTQYSRVLLCLDSAARQQLVVKELMENAPDILIRQMKREAELLRRLSGSGSPRLITFCPDDFRPWLAEEYMDGTRLDQWLSGKRTRSEKKSGVLSDSAAGGKDTPARLSLS